jgi:hypothetical protein
MAHFVLLPRRKGFGGDVEELDVALIGIASWPDIKSSGYVH